MIRRRPTQRTCGIRRLPRDPLTGSVADISMALNGYLVRVGLPKNELGKVYRPR